MDELFPAHFLRIEYPSYFSAELLLRTIPIYIIDDRLPELVTSCQMVWYPRRREDEVMHRWACIGGGRGSELTVLAGYGPNQGWLSPGRVWAESGEQSGG